MGALLASGIIPPLLALLVYAPVLGHGLLWDDSAILERQLPGLTVSKALLPPSNLHQWSYHYYRPMVVLSLLLDRALYGTDPFGYHLTVLLLHAAVSYSVFLLGTRWMSPARATLGGSLFAVFPLHAECVGWIAGRTDVLASLFGVLAVALFSKGLGPWAGSRALREGSSPPGGFSRLALAGSGALFLGALLSKESAIALVPVFLAAAWMGGAVRYPRMAGWALGVVLASVGIYLAMRVLLNPGARTAAITTGGHPALRAVLGAGFYFPTHLLAPFGSPYRLSPPSGILLTLAAVGLVGLGIFAGIRSFQRCRWDCFLPLLWVAATCSATAAAAAWNLTRTPVADRYLYMPAVGWCLLLAAMSTTLDSRSALARRGWLGTALGLALAGVYMIGSHQRTPLYADEMSFWTAAVAAEPASGAAWINLGNALYAHGQSDRAVDSYRRALSLPLSAQDRSLALTDLGAVLYQNDRLEEAERILREAAALAPNSSTQSFNLGAFLYQKGLASQSRSDAEEARRAFEEARVHLRRAVDREATHSRAWMLLGHCEQYRGNAVAARGAWTRVIEIDGPEGPVGREAAIALSRTGPRGLPRGGGAVSTSGCGALNDSPCMLGSIPEGHFRQIFVDSRPTP